VSISLQFWRGRRLEPFFLHARYPYWRVIRIWRFVLHFDNPPGEKGSDGS
jgi:hypothetical protein